MTAFLRTQLNGMRQPGFALRAAAWRATVIAQESTTIASAQDSRSLDPIGAAAAFGERAP